MGVGVTIRVVKSQLTRLDLIQMQHKLQYNMQYIIHYMIAYSTINCSTD